MRSYKRHITLLFALVSMLFAEQYELYPGEDAVELISQLEAGDTLLVKVGVHKAITKPIKVKGTPEKPIIIRGEDPDLSIFSSWDENYFP